jgi:hypothetical protein
MLQLLDPPAVAQADRAGAPPDRGRGPTSPPSGPTAADC